MWVGEIRRWLLRGGDRVERSKYFWGNLDNLCPLPTFLKSEMNSVRNFLCRTEGV